MDSKLRTLKSKKLREKTKEDIFFSLNDILDDIKVGRLKLSDSIVTKDLIQNCSTSSGWSLLYKGKAKKPAWRVMHQEREKQSTFFALGLTDNSSNEKFKGTEILIGFEEAVCLSLWVAAFPCSVKEKKQRLENAKQLGAALQAIHNKDWFYEVEQVLIDERNFEAKLVDAQEQKKALYGIDMQISVMVGSHYLKSLQEENKQPLQGLYNRDEESVGRTCNFHSEVFENGNKHELINKLGFEKAASKKDVKEWLQTFRASINLTPQQEVDRRIGNYNREFAKNKLYPLVCHQYESYEDFIEKELRPFEPLTIYRYIRKTHPDSDLTYNPPYVDMDKLEIEV